MAFTRKSTQQNIFTSMQPFGIVFFFQLAIFDAFKHMLTHMACISKSFHGAVTSVVHRNYHIFSINIRKPMRSIVMRKVPSECCIHHFSPVLPFAWTRSKQISHDLLVSNVSIDVHSFRFFRLKMNIFMFIISWINDVLFVVKCIRKINLLQLFRSNIFPAKSVHFRCSCWY